VAAVLGGLTDRNVEVELPGGWMDMIESRNKTVHTYLEDVLEKEYQLIVTRYYPLFEKFHQKMTQFL